MQKIISSLAIIIICLLPFSASAATSFGYSENSAQAYFSSVQGCEDVVVGVSVVEPESIKPKAPLATTDAFIFASFNNICDIGSSYSFAGVVTLDDAAFDQNGLNGATLNLTTNIGGFDVVIALDWDGIGKTDKNRNKIHIKQDGMIVHDSDVIANRAAEITGTFSVNGINYAVGTQTGGLGSVKAHTVQIQK